VRDSREESQPPQPQKTQQRSERNVLDQATASTANLINKVLPEEDDISDGGEESIVEVLSLHYEGETYNHKENQPLIPRDDAKVRRLRFVDRQSNAERVTWSQDRDEAEYSPQTTRRKRSRREVEDEIEEEDDDAAFEIDPRPVDLSRREQAALPVTQARSQLQRTQDSPKRQRTERREGSEEDSTDVAERRRGDRSREGQLTVLERIRETQIATTRDEGAAQAGPSRASAQVVDDDDAPSSSYAFVKETAREAMMKYRAPKGPQQRLRWSEDETDTLINLIDRYGCSWSRILEKGRGMFAESRDQVALKDKARNLKVELLM
jgi:hypothetical protein